MNYRFDYEQITEAWKKHGDGIRLRAELEVLGRLSDDTIDWHVHNPGQRRQLIFGKVLTHLDFATEE